MKKLMLCVLLAATSLSAMADGEIFAIKAKGDRLRIDDKDSMPPLLIANLEMVDIETATLTLPGRPPVIMSLKYDGRGFTASADDIYKLGGKNEPSIRIMGKTHYKKGRLTSISGVVLDYKYIFSDCNSYYKFSSTVKK